MDNHHTPSAVPTPRVLTLTEACLLLSVCIRSLTREIDEFQKAQGAPRKRRTKGFSVSEAWLLQRLVPKSCQDWPAPTSIPEPLLKVVQAAALLGVSPKSAGRLVEDNLLRAYKFRNALLFFPSDVIKRKESLTLQPSKTDKVDDDHIRRQTDPGPAS